MNYDEVTLSEITENLAKLLSNTTNLTNAYFDMFFNPTPMDITLTQYDANNELVTYNIPNRAKDKRICLSGTVPPELNVVAVEGTFYINETTNSLYYKSYGDSNIGWQLTLTQDDLTNHNASLFAHDGILVNYSYIGNRDDLVTNDKTDIVGAINSCKKDIDDNVYSPFTVNSGYLNSSGKEEIIYSGNTGNITVTRNLPNYANQQEAEDGVNHISMNRPSYYTIIGKNSTYATVSNDDNIFEFTIINANRTAVSFDFSTVYYENAAEYSYVTQIRGYEALWDRWTVLYTSSDFAQNLTSIEGNKRNYVSVPIPNNTAYNKYEVTLAQSTEQTVPYIGVSKINLTFVDVEQMTHNNIYFKTGNFYEDATLTNAYRERGTLKDQEPIDMLGKPIGTHYVYAKLGSVYTDETPVTFSPLQPVTISGDGHIEDGELVTSTYVKTIKAFHPKQDDEWEILLNVVTGQSVTGKAGLISIPTAVYTTSHYLEVYIYQGKVGVNIPIVVLDNQQQGILVNKLLDNAIVEPNRQYFIKMFNSNISNTISIQMSEDGINYADIATFSLQVPVYIEGEVVTKTSKVLFPQDYITGEIDRYTEERYAKQYPNLLTKLGTVEASVTYNQKDTPVFESQAAATSGVGGITLSPAQFYSCTGNTRTDIPSDTEVIFGFDTTSTRRVKRITFTSQTDLVDSASAVISAVAFYSNADTSWHNIGFSFSKLEQSATGYIGEVTFGAFNTEDFPQLKLIVSPEDSTTQLSQVNISNITIEYEEAVTLSGTGDARLTTNQTSLSINNEVFWALSGIKGQKWLNTKKEPVECLEFNGVEWVPFMDVQVGQVEISGSTVSGGQITDTAISSFRTYPYNRQVLFDSGVCMPSGLYTDLTLGASGSVYTIQSNGYYLLHITNSVANGSVYMYNQTTGFTAPITRGAAGIGLATYIPARKGEQIQINYEGYSEIIKFRFYYTDGAGL